MVLSSVLHISLISSSTIADMATPLKPWEQRGAGLWQMGDTPRRLATTPGVAQASQPPVSSPPPAVPPRTMTSGSSECVW